MLKLYSHLVTLYFINLLFYNSFILKISIKVPGLLSKRRDKKKVFQRREKMKLVLFALYLAIPVSNRNVNLLLICVMQIGKIPALSDVTTQEQWRTCAFINLTQSFLPIVSKKPCRHSPVSLKWTLSTAGFVRPSGIRRVFWNHRHVNQDFF